jgi:hypothetical protein
VKVEKSPKRGDHPSPSSLEHPLGGPCLLSLPRFDSVPRRPLISLADTLEDCGSSSREKASSRLLSVASEAPRNIAKPHTATALRLNQTRSCTAPQHSLHVYHSTADLFVRRDSRLETSICYAANRLAVQHRSQNSLLRYMLFVTNGGQAILVVITIRHQDPTRNRGVRSLWLSSNHTKSCGFHRPLRTRHSLLLRDRRRQRSGRRR